MSKICVLGQGYIGLPTALLFANNGHEVGIDVNKRVVNTKAGKCLEEKGSGTSGRSHCQKSLQGRTLVEEADAFLVAVTPFDSK